MHIYAAIMSGLGQAGLVVLLFASALHLTDYADRNLNDQRLARFLFKLVAFLLVLATGTALALLVWWLVHP